MQGTGRGGARGAAVGMWRAAGREDKFAGRGGRAHEDGVGGKDDGAAIEEFADVDALAGIGAAGRPARDLQDA